MLVFLASGITEAEQDKVFLGQSDSPITEAGMADLRDAADLLKPYRFDHTFVSDLYRAQETASVVIGTHASRCLVEALRERSAGSYEGMKLADIRKGMSPKQYRVWDRDPMESPLHGESMQDVMDRLHEWIDHDLAPRMQNNESILIISHPCTLKVLVGMVRGDNWDDIIGMEIEHGVPYFFYGEIGSS